MIFTVRTLLLLVCGNLRANHTHSCHKLRAFIAPLSTHQSSPNHVLCARLPTLIIILLFLARATLLLCAVALRVRPARLTFLGRSSHPTVATRNAHLTTVLIIIGSVLCWGAAGYSTCVRKEKTLTNDQKYR